MKLKVICALLVICTAVPCDSIFDETLCPEEALLDLTGQTRNSDGSIEFKKLHFPKEKLWIKDNKVLACPCMVAPCLSFCCESPGCDKNVNSSMLLPYSSRRVADFWTVFLDPCHGGDLYDLLSDKNKKPDDFQFQNDGTLFYLGNNYSYSKFCVDKSNEELHLYFCAKESSNSNIVTVSLVISTIFLSFTFLVYLLLPELRNIHGKTLCAHVACLIVAFSSLCYFRLFNQDIADLYCKMFGIYSNLYVFFQKTT